MEIKKFLEIEDNIVYENKYNYHPYTSFCCAEHIVKRFGWKKCKEIVLENIKKGYSSKMNLCTSTGYQYDFFASDLQHLLSFYYKNIPKYY